MTRELIAEVSLVSGTTADDLKELLGRLGSGDWEVKRVHDPDGGEPDFYVDRPADDAEEVSD